MLYFIGFIFLLSLLGRTDNEDIHIRKMTEKEEKQAQEANFKKWLDKL